jgi:hypothetical protein
MALQFTTSYQEDSLAVFHYYKNLVERAIAQVTDEQLAIGILNSRLLPRHARNYSPYGSRAGSIFSRHWNRSRNRICSER